MEKEFKKYRTYNPFQDTSTSHTLRTLETTDSGELSNHLLEKLNSFERSISDSIEQNPDLAEAAEMVELEKILSEITLQFKEKTRKRHNNPLNVLSKPDSLNLIYYRTLDNLSKLKYLIDGGFFSGGHKKIEQNLYNIAIDCIISLIIKENKWKLFQ